MNCLKLAVSLAATSFAFAILLTSASATCPTFHQLQNRQVADATQVMDNFNYILQCPNFTGNVGIGTTTPGTLFDVYGGSARVTNGYYINAYYGTSYSSAGSLAFQRAEGTATTPSAVLVGDLLGILSFRGYNGSGFTGSKGWITSAATENWSATANGTDYIFYTTPNGTSSISAVMLMDNNGGVGIGGGNYTTTGYPPANGLIVHGNVGIGTTTPSAILDVAGTPNFSGSPTQNSDFRLKTAITPLSGGSLNAILALKPVTFRWIHPNDAAMEGLQTGFIAQDVERILPTAVTVARDPAKTRALKYNEITAVLVKALQEEHEIVQGQSREITALQRANRQLSARLSRVERTRVASSR